VKLFHVVVAIIIILSLILCSCSVSSPSPSTQPVKPSPSAPTAAATNVSAASPTTAPAKPVTTAPPTTSIPLPPPTTSIPLPPPTTAPAVAKNWHLVEVQQYDTYAALKPPYHIIWKGQEGDIINTVTGDLPGNPISAINAKWSIPPAVMVPGTEYSMDLSVTAVNQHTANLGLEGRITCGIDQFEVLPGAATGARIQITPEDKVPRIVWNAADGTVKSGKFPFKAPDYGFANSKTSSKITLTVQYYSSATLAWRYIYEWSDKDVKAINTVYTPPATAK
jgi:hypothetical protein